MEIKEGIYNFNGPPIEFYIDITNKKDGSSAGFYWYNGDFEQSNYNNKVIAEWIDIEDYKKSTIVKVAKKLKCNHLCIGKNQSGSHFFAVGFLVKVK